MTETILDWPTGQTIDPLGRKKILRAAGILSRTGDAARQLGGFGRYLQRELGYSVGDFLEATYFGADREGSWNPLPYEQTHCAVPIATSTERVIRLLRWYDARLPAEMELHLLGYSLGGVVLFSAAVALLGEDPTHWRERLVSIVTLSSPHFGTDLGEEGDLLNLFGFSALILPEGVVGQELVARGRDPTHRERVERDADFLRRHGVRPLTLADEFDTVVTPEDAVISPASERSRFTLRSSRAEIGGAYRDALLGHGPILDNLAAWRLMGEVLGPQVPRLRTSSGAIPLGPPRR